MCEGNKQKILQKIRPDCKSYFSEWSQRSDIRDLIHIIGQRDLMTNRLNDWQTDRRTDICVTFASENYQTKSHGEVKKVADPNDYFIS